MVRENTFVFIFTGPCTEVFDITWDFPGTNLFVSVAGSNSLHGAQNNELNGSSSLLSLNVENSLIMAEFDERRVVTAIQTQGENGAYVKQYKIMIYDAGWRSISNDDGHDLVFDGNTDGHTIVTNYLPEPVETGYVRLHVVDYYSAPALRWAILGCPLE